MILLIPDHCFSTYLTRSVSIQSLMSEIGLLPLSERSKFQKLVIILKCAMA